MMNQGHLYLRNIIGLPFGISVDRIQHLADLVRNELATPSACHDLSMPDPADWHVPTPLIDLVFTQHPSYHGLPVSVTTRNNEVITCTVFYCLNDLNCNELMNGRIIHELTHGIRARIILDFNAQIPQANRYSEKTPPKAPAERLFKNRYKMGEMKFHSGYWMEHRLLNGITVILLGRVCDGYIDNHRRLQGVLSDTGDEGLFFKIVEKGGWHKSASDGEWYETLHGYYLSGPRANQYVTIYHCGDRLSRDNSD